ncbi:MULTISPECIES: HpcH/HpaI aldolase/citrate lyase family protein [Halorussus]|uniref:HpcH/HpaI aldolase/citrate lyase family protein n=1 Tax=Halorussus TaxID=1070314 RepID=UPI00209DB337|nr:CoA ester lyase [Halorussus vallis]USZ76261.1 CoA ester lyase [Halorussus vallis]
MPRRSVLFTPGDRPEMLRKAPGAGADVIVFDLEDAVAPGRKDEAREAVREVLADPEFSPDCEVCVRVNPTGIAADDDVRAVVGGGTDLDAVMLPKTESADDAETLSRLLDERDCSVPILALVETAAGVLAAEEIAELPDVDALVFGAEDLTADIGATRTAEGTEVLHAREHVVLAASAADVDAIDTVYTDIEDAEGLREETEFAVELGYDGKMAIHPAQVSVVNEAFTPAPERVEWAERVLAAREEADAEDRGVFRVDGEMIDAPLIAQAERIMAYARAAEEE